MENQELNNGEKFKKNKTKKKIGQSGWSDLSSIVHWGLINVRRKPENPESDSWGAGILARRTGGGGEEGREEKECANLVEWTVNNSHFKKMYHLQLGAWNKHLCCMVLPVPLLCINVQYACFSELKKASNHEQPSSLSTFKCIRLLQLRCRPLQNSNPFSTHNAIYTTH